MATFAWAIEYVLANEGGFSDVADDPGRETKYGISKQRYPDEDIPNLTWARAIELYKRDYWDGRGLDDLASQAIANKVFDMAVNLGPTVATRLLQRALNFLVPKPHEIRMDGVLGPLTLALANRQDPELLRLTLSAYHVAHYISLVEGPDPRFETFAKGWLRRSLA